MSTFSTEAIRAEIAQPHGEVARYWKELLAGEFGPTGLPLSASSNKLASSLLVKSGAGMLFGLSGINTNVGAQFIQVFDAQSLPADGAVPVVVITAAAPAAGSASNFSMDWVFPGRFFKRGIVICNSSTAATKTIGAADCWFDAQFI